MQIGIVNAGNMGLVLAMAWIRRGHDIMLSKDTNSEKLRERVRAFGLEHGLNESELSRFKYGSLADAAKFGDAVIFSTYFPRLNHVLEELRNSGITFSTKIVIETMNPVNVDADFNHFHDLEYMQKTSITEEIQKAFPEAAVFKAFNTVPATLINAQKWASGRLPAIPFVGGSPSTVAPARKLIEDAGLRPQFAGHNLENARLMERLGIFMHLLAENEYEGDLNIALDVIRPSR